jgi:hypothetical protein
MANNTPEIFGTFLIDTATGQRVPDPGLIVLNSKLRSINSDVRDKVKNISQRAADAAADVYRSEIGKQSGALYKSIKVSEKSAYSPGGAPFEFFQRSEGLLVNKFSSFKKDYFEAKETLTGGGYYQATVKVGEGVPHAAYYFKGTGKYRRELVGDSKTNSIWTKNRIYAFGEENHGLTEWARKNPKIKQRAVYYNKAAGIYSASFTGQKDNLDIILKARRASNAVLSQGFRNIKAIQRNNITFKK